MITRQAQCTFLFIATQQRRNLPSGEHSGGTQSILIIEEVDHSKKLSRPKELERVHLRVAMTITETHDARQQRKSNKHVVVVEGTIDHLVQSAHVTIQLVWGKQN